MKRISLRKCSYGVLPVLLIMILLIQPDLRASEDQKGILSGFEWTPTEKGRRFQKVSTNKPISIPFEVYIKELISKVSFSISGDFKGFGIHIKDETAAVNDGRTGSLVIFNVPSGMPFGRHNLVISVTDTISGNIIGSGFIPFILLPSGFDCLC